MSVKNLILAGAPGVGKTTLVKECTFPFRNLIGGFYTEEIREGRERRGFQLKTYDGRSGTLARKGMASLVKMNKYGVDLDVLNGLGLTAVREAAQSKKVIVIDEIGSMEMLSPQFSVIVGGLLMGPKPVLATIRLNAQPFTRQIGKMSDTKLVVLKRELFPVVKEEVKAWLERWCFS